MATFTTKTLDNLDAAGALSGTDLTIVEQGDSTSRQVSLSDFATFVASTVTGTVAVEDDGAGVLSAADTLNFTGSGVIVTDGGGGQANIAIAGGIAGIDVEDDGSGVLTAATTVNFTGSGVTVTDGGGGQANIAIAGGIAGIDVEDDGSGVLADATVLNFTGAGVAVTDAGGGQANIDIPAGIAGVDVEDDGSSVVTSSTLDFTGLGVTVTDISGTATIAIPDHNVLNVRYRNVTSHTPSLGQAYDYFVMNSLLANTFDIPTNATEAFPLGTWFYVEQGNTGQTTISPAAGVDLFTPTGTTTIDAQYGVVFIVKTGTDKWVASGDFTPASGGGGVDVEDSGSSVVTGATVLNFTGAGVAVTDAGSGQADIDISGATGSGEGYFGPLSSPLPSTTEFPTVHDGGSTNASFSAANSASRGLILTGENTTGSTNFYLRSKTASPPGAGNTTYYTCRAMLSAGDVGGNPVAGIGLYNSGNDRFVTVGVSGRANVVPSIPFSKWTLNSSGSTFSANYANWNMYNYDWWFRLVVDDSGSLTAEVSKDGENWSYYDDTTLSDWLTTYTHVSLLLKCGSSAGRTSHATFPFFSEVTV